MLTPEDLLQLTHSVTISGHWTVNFRDQSLFWSEEMFQLHGLAPGSQQPDLASAINIYHPQDRENVQAAVNRTLQARVPLDFVARIVDGEGGIRRVHALGRIKYHQSGEPLLLFGVFRDITREWQQQRHNQRLANALENTSEIIILTDPAGHVVWVNAAFTRVTGHACQDVLGKKPGELLQGQDTDPKTVAYIHQKLAKAEPFTAEILNYRRDGQSYWLRISCQPDFEEDGELMGFAAIQTDITAEKHIRLDLQREVESRKELEQQLRYLATHDELSAMPNRRHFMQQGEIELGRSRRHQQPLSLVLVDLDHFKKINDQYGHGVGDRVIQEFARLCEKILRGQDMAARVGGEEFVVLLPQTDLAGARILAERLRTELAATPMMVAEAGIEVTASLGVVEAMADKENLGAVLARADRALYQAKNAGRNQVVAGSATD